MSSYLDPKLNRLLGATLEDVLGFAGYYLIAETFDVVILRATYEMTNRRTVMSGMSVDKVIEFLIDRNTSWSDHRPFGCAVSGAGINVVPASYSVYRCKEVSPAIVTGSTPEIWEWVKSKGLLEQYVYERSPINQSMIGSPELYPN